MLTAISTAFHKGGWGMWPILFTSVVTIALIVERAVYLFRASVDKDKLLALLKSQVMSGNVQGAIKVCSGNPTPMNCTAFGIGGSLVALLGYSLLQGKTTHITDDINEVTVQVVNLVTTHRSQMSPQ